MFDFHYRLEYIHPFRDINGRVDRPLLFKECLGHNIMPFVIDEKLKMFYCRGLTEWPNEKGLPAYTCLSVQNVFKTRLDYFGIICEEWYMTEQPKK